MAVLFTAPFVTALNLSGLPIAGATLTFYATGTSTLATIYADGGNVTPLSNPVAADAAGRFPTIYLGAGIYRAVLKDASGTVIRDTDPIGSGASASVKDYGAKGDGITDDSVAIRNAITALAGVGVLRLSKGTYAVSQDGSNAWCLNIPATIRVVGDGSGISVIYPVGVPDTCDIIRIYPSALYDNRGGGVFDLAILYPNNGTRAGRDAIRIDTLTTAASPITAFEIARVQTGSPTAATPGWAVHFINDAVANPSGGSFCAHVHDNVLNGGVRLENVGDSMRVCKNTLTGPNVGCWATLVNGTAGPSSQLILGENNVTSSGGCFRIDVGAATYIYGTNGENFTPGALAKNGGALIWFPKPAAWSGATAYTVGNLAYLSGQSYRCTAANTNQTPPNATYWAATDPAAGSLVEGNLVSNFGTSDATMLVNVECGTNITVRGNRLLNGLGGINCLNIGPAATGAVVGPNIYVSTTAEANRVVDAGVGTVGIPRTPALQSGWVGIGAGETDPYREKDQFGIVTVGGAMKNGTFNPGDLIATLDVGFRPLNNERRGVMVLTGTTYSMGEVLITTSGQMVWAGGGGATRVNLGFSFRAANSANGSV